MSIISDNSRADYFKKRRSKYKAFHVEIEKDKMEKFEQKISEKNLSKKEWLDRKIDEEISDTKK